MLTQFYDAKWHHLATMSYAGPGILWDKYWNGWHNNYQRKLADSASAKPGAAFLNMD